MKLWFLFVMARPYLSTLDDSDDQSVALLIGFVFDE